MGDRKRHRGHFRLSLRTGILSSSFDSLLSKPKSDVDSYGAYLSFTALCFIVLHSVALFLFSFVFKHKLKARPSTTKRLCSLYCGVLQLTHKIPDLGHYVMFFPEQRTDAIWETAKHQVESYHLKHSKQLHSEKWGESELESRLQILTASGRVVGMPRLCIWEILTSC